MDSIGTSFTIKLLIIKTVAFHKPVDPPTKTSFSFIYAKNLFSTVLRIIKNHTH